MASPRRPPTKGFPYIHANTLRVVRWYWKASSLLKCVGAGIYSSCTGIADPNLNSSEASENLSDSDEDVGGVPGIYLA